MEKSYYPGSSPIISCAYYHLRAHPQYERVMANTNCIEYEKQRILNDSDRENEKANEKILPHYLYGTCQLFDRIRLVIYEFHKFLWNPPVSK